MTTKYQGAMSSADVILAAIQKANGHLLNFFVGEALTQYRASKEPK